MNFSKRILSLLALLLAMANHALCGEAEDYVSRGIEKVKFNDLDGAIADFSKAIELKHDLVDAYYDRAKAKESKGDLDGALIDANKAIELKPDHVFAYGQRGWIKYVKGDLDGAIADYTKAIELQPDSPIGYYCRGLAKRQKGDLDGAVADYDKAIERKPDDIQAISNRGLAKRIKGDLVGAMADFTKVANLNPTLAWGYSSQACLQYGEQQFTNALVNYLKAVKLDSTLDYSHFRIWLIQARLNKQDVATKELKVYLEDRKTGRPNDWPSNIARFLTGQLTEPNFFKAAANADKKIENGQQCEAYFYAGTKRLVAGDKTTATNYFEKCLATGVKDFEEYSSAAAELKFLKAAK